MTIIVFLIDTSASMNQRAYSSGRLTLLDAAKNAVEAFVKVRQRYQESRVDRYMLLTFEDPPHNIKAGWKENLATFMNELKNLECTGLTTMGSALKHAFDVLNINRMQTGIDTYGQGRCPFFLEPSVIVVITDGGKLSNVSGVPEEFILPMNSPIPGSELTREPFRWDQRLFSLVLRLSGTPAMERDTGLVPSDVSPIDAMCEVTGGRSYCITSQRMLMQCIDSLVQKVQSGVVINFEKIGPDPPPVDAKDENFDQSEMQEEKTEKPEDTCKNSTGWQSCRKLIYVPKSAQKGLPVGHWPIPESFWPDLSASSLPPRTAHPNLKFTCTSQEPMVIENLPFDKYELEPSPLTQYILARKQPTVCWQVFVTNSYKNSEAGHPFGYLKASTNLSCVNLFVMPYNYPVLLQLLDDLFKTHRLKPTNEWRMQLANYLKMMPSYYLGPLKRALTKMGAPAQSLIPETSESSISFSVMQYLKKLKIQAKNEFDRLCDEVGNKQNNKNINEGIRVVPRSPLKKSFISHPLLQEKFSSLKEQLNDFTGFVVGIPKSGEQKVGSGGFRNPFDIPRRNLLDHVLKMRKNFLHTSLAQENYEWGQQCDLEDPFCGRCQFDDFSGDIFLTTQNTIETHCSWTGFSVRRRYKGVVVPLEYRPVNCLSIYFEVMPSAFKSLDPFMVHVFSKLHSGESKIFLTTLIFFDMDLIHFHLNTKPQFPSFVLLKSYSHETKCVGYMKDNFRHSMPLSQMGNYQEHLKRLPPPLKEIETTPVRQHMFGNPFKIDKRMMVDEADVDVVGSLGRGTKRPLSDPGSPKPNNRRKPGPLPKNYTTSRVGSLSPRPATPVQSTNVKVENVEKPLNENEKEVETIKMNGKNINPAQKTSGLNIFKNSNYKNSPPGSPIGVPNLVNEVDGEDMDIDIEMNGVRVGESYGSRSRSPSPPVLTNENLQPYEPCNDNMEIYQLYPPTITIQNDIGKAGTERREDKVGDRRKANSKTSNKVKVTIDLEEIRTHNLKIKKLAFKYVRKPGKNYSQLLACLKTIKGGNNVKLNLIKEVVRECLRFKRRNLANLVDLLITQNPDH